MSTTIVEAVARKLGGASVLGVAIRSQADLALAVRNRLPLAALKGLSRAGLTEQEIEKFVIPQRTRRHRADKRQPLTIDESDRAVRLLRIQTLAEETLADADKAAKWLRRGLAELGGESPLGMARTEAGARVIETILAIDIVALHDLPADWRRQEALPQQRGDAWHDRRSAPLLGVPSAVVPVADSPDINILINHAPPAPRRS